RFGIENSRVDILLQDHVGQRCYVEVKNVTAVDARGVAVFPDAVSRRGAKHLRELVRVLEQGDRAAIVYCVARSDVHALRVAHEIDPDYAKALNAALAAGVEALAYQAQLATQGVALNRRLPVVRLA
ncbi:MAG: DNA/RNA nuclease SfsA, partial [Pseudomonadota bacterium]